MIRVRFVCLVLVALLFAGTVSAQAVVTNPTTVTFTASADHSTLDVGGAALVAGYSLRVYVSTDLTAVVTSLDLGKPTPAADGTITVTNGVWFAALTPKTKYVAKVAAYGPDGEGVSDPSNPFGNSAPPAKPGPPAVKK